MTGPRLDLPPLMCNTRPSELADSTIIGKPPHGMTTRAYYVGLCLRGQLQKLVPAAIKQGQFLCLDVELPLREVITWTGAKDERELRLRLDRLLKGFGMLPEWPNDDRPRMRPPVLDAYEIRGNGRRLWYEIEHGYLKLPVDDYYFLRLASLQDAVGDRKRFRELKRSAAEAAAAEVERRARDYYARRRRR